MFKKTKNTVPWTYVVSDRNGNETVGMFYEIESQKTNQKDLELKSNKKKRQ